MCPDMRISNTFRSFLQLRAFKQKDGQVRYKSILKAIKRICILRVHWCALPWSLSEGQLYAYATLGDGCTQVKSEITLTASLICKFTTLITKVQAINEKYIAIISMQLCFCCLLLFRKKFFTCKFAYIYKVFNIIAIFWWHLYDVDLLCAPAFKALYSWGFNLIFT